jgi:anti-sigma factor RsiW
MNCDEVRSLLPKVLGGSLSGETARQVRVHLAECPACSAALIPADRVEALIARDEIVTPSENLQERFIARLEAHMQQTEAMERIVPLWSRIRSWSLPQQLAAAGALGVLGAIGVYLNTGSVPNVAEPPPAEVAIAESLPLLQDMEVIENLELMENFDVIQGLSDAAPSPQ